MIAAISAWLWACCLRAHELATCSRSSAGSKWARLVSTSARKRAEGNPLETIVWAAWPGEVGGVLERHKRAVRVA